MKNKPLRLCAACLLSLIPFATPAKGTLIQLEGDFGTQNTSGTTVLLGVGNTVTENFSFTHATGTLTGDVVAQNLGAAFELTITNLSYEPTAAGAVTGVHSIELYVGQEYVATAGVYNASHDFAGTSDLGAGQNASINMQTTHNFSATLPGLFDTVAGGGVGLPLSDGPVAQNVTTTGNIHVIETWLALTIDGGVAASSKIVLPASAHVSATLVPESATFWLLLPLAVWLAFRAGAKRRRCLAR